MFNKKNKYYVRANVAIPFPRVTLLPNDVYELVDQDAYVTMKPFFTVANEDGELRATLIDASDIAPGQTVGQLGGRMFAPLATRDAPPARLSRADILHRFEWNDEQFDHAAFLNFPRAAGQVARQSSTGVPTYGPLDFFWWEADIERWESHIRALGVDTFAAAGRR